MLNAIKKIAPILQGMKRGLNPLNSLKPVKSEKQENDKGRLLAMSLTSLTVILIICFSFILVIKGIMDIETFKKIINKILLLIGIEL
jgi:hypothetical protein